MRYPFLLAGVLSCLVEMALPNKNSEGTPLRIRTLDNCDGGIGRYIGLEGIKFSEENLYFQRAQDRTRNVVT